MREMRQATGGTPEEARNMSIGEGFAYFRWHFHKWRYCCTCPYTSGPGYCKALWEAHERA
jgi:hypothetical protein